MKFRWRLEHTMEQVIKKRLQQVMDASVAKGETPGCLLMVIKDGEEQVYLESGYADIEAKKPVSRDNIFRLYSMSKPITATAMMSAESSIWRIRSASICRASGTRLYVQRMGR